MVLNPNLLKSEVEPVAGLDQVSCGSGLLKEQAMCRIIKIAESG